jgi:glycosyltransferase involved in cell wall biosynthesis
MKRPKVSVVVPAYNAEAGVEKAVGSILNQTQFADEIEILIVDDRSADNTSAIVTRLTALHPEVKLFTNARGKGPSGARNTALLHATGDYVAFLDADDVWHPDHLEKGIPFLERQPEVDVIVFNFDIVEQETGRTMKDWFSEKKYPRALKSRELESGYFLIEDDMLDALIQESFLHLQAMIVRRRAVANLMFNETIMRSGDRDFAISLAQVSGARYAYSDIKTGVWYRHAASLTSNKAANFLAMSLDHVAFFTRYMELYGDRPETARILRQALWENHLDICYSYRSERQYRLSYQHLFASLRYRAHPVQLREFLKLSAAAALSLVQREPGPSA